MSTKIQINSLAALERLIGGDNALELEIRQSVVTEFVKKHLKGLVDTRIVQLASNDLRANIDEAVNKQISKTIGEYQRSGYGAHKFIIHNDLKEDIKNHLKKALDDTINEAITEFIPGVEKQIEESFTRVLNYKIDQIVRDKVNDHLKKIKESL